MFVDEHEQDGHAERLVSEVMERAAGQYAPHSAGLVDRAVVRGRSLRRARRIQVSLGAAVVVAALTGSVVGLGGLPGRGAVPPAGVASRAPSPAVPSALSPAPAAPEVSTADPGARSGPLDRQLAAFLTGSGTTGGGGVSDGTFTDGLIGSGQHVDAMPPGKGASGQLLLDDGHGRARIEVVVLDTPGHQSNAPSSCHPDSTRTCETLTDATWVSSWQHPTVHSVTLWTVQVERSDGRTVMVSAANGDYLPDPVAGPTRDQPPLTMDALRTIALSSHWDR